MTDEPTYTITGLDRETGQQVTYPLTEREATEIGLLTYGLDPGSFLDPDAKRTFTVVRTSFEDDEDDG